MLFHAPRVFMIGWEYPPHNSGGLGVACEGMTQALSGQNTQIYFTLPYPLPTSLAHMNVMDCSDPTWFAENGTPQPPFFAYQTQLPQPQMQHSTFSQTGVDAHVLHALPQSELETKVERYAELVTSQAIQKQHAYDVVHAHDWMSFPAALKLSQSIRKPFVAHIHSTEFDRIPGGMGSSYIMETEYAGMMAATRVVAVSYYTKNVLVKEYGINPDKIDVVHNGISPLSSQELKELNGSSTSFAPNRPVIVFMGRLTMQKGADYFLAVAEKVIQQVPAALFVLAGDGDMYHQLLIQNAQKGLSASLLFSGFVRDTQRSQLLNRATVFVMPSLSEPFGLVALEAAQRNTPVIVSKNTGVAEVLPSAVQVDFWDINRMSSEITRLIRSKSDNAQQVAAQFDDLKQTTWDQTAQKMKTVYSKAFFGEV